MFYGFILAIFAALLIVYYRLDEKSKSLQLFEYNVNCSMCVLCLGNDSFCKTLDFQLDYERYPDIIEHSDYLSKLMFLLIRFFNRYTRQQNDKIFFGFLKLNNDTVKSVVAKSPGHYYSKMFEQKVDTSADLDTIVTTRQWTLLPFSEESRILVICSQNDTQQYSLLDNLFSSAVDIKNSNNSRLMKEAWVAAHLSVELLILKMLKGYHYAPAVYGICGIVYFVEDCGQTLQYYLNKMKLTTRLLVAIELLKLALELTDGTAHPNYLFYLTDLTADNISVQLDKTSSSLISLKVIDWSDVIVVPYDQIMKTNDNLNIHVSEHVDCELGCLTYSKEDICRAGVSDHNVYAVCKEFLSVESRLLHEITDVNSKLIPEKKKKNLEYLINQCLYHTNSKSQLNGSRLDTAKLLITEIQQIFK